MKGRRFTAFLISMIITLFIFRIGMMYPNNELTLGTLTMIQFIAIAYIGGQSASDGIRYYKNNQQENE